MVGLTHDERLVIAHDAARRIYFAVDPLSLTEIGYEVDAALVEALAQERKRIAAWLRQQGVAEHVIREVEG